MVRSNCQAMREAAVRAVAVFYCKDGRQITNADSPTLGRTACVDTVSHLSLSHRARFRVTASSTFTSYLWMHVKLVYSPPPPHRVGFRNSFRLIRTLTFCGTNPAWLNTDQIQRRILLSECPASSSCVIVREWRVGGEEDVQLFRFTVIKCCVLSGMVRTQRWR